ncbi:hypothetical protein DEO72_LG7g606 [Vigna unguiculata]|uniref:Uncharacterized protein n=1 Tax=Vigna unguiculata TaxID=3917 RepID=A0A4D6MD85_VIGUN|nr:hypothetical protein DEO72_LG7g606 [Vigna unguiculata]
MTEKSSFSFTGHFNMSFNACTLDKLLQSFRALLPLNKRSVAPTLEDENEATTPPLFIDEETPICGDDVVAGGRLSGEASCERGRVLRQRWLGEKWSGREKWMRRWRRRNPQTTTTVGWQQRRNWWWQSAARRSCRENWGRR